MKTNLYSIGTLLVVSVLIVYFVFRPVFRSPEGILFAPSDDAIKSYFNFAYYLKYDDGIKLDAINYPYGEHLMYDNTHPLYSAILKFVDRHIHPVASHAVGILNMTMILSLIIALPFLFLILRKFGLPAWYSVLVSMIIVFLSPQLNRISGHFEMVYAFFIPLYWYLLIRWRERKNRLLWGSILAAAGLIGGFTSAYYAAFYTVFMLAVLLIEIWTVRNNFRENYHNLIWLFVIAILPVVIVKGFVGLTDWADDRPDNPWGFFIFHSNIYSIFLPSFSPLQYLAGKFLNIQFEWEGRAYVGLPATLYVLVIVITVLFYLIRWKKVRWDAILPEKEINLYLAAGIITLLFSMCIPFEQGFAFLLDIITPLKQFRALGRFSWIFYYIFTVATAWYIYFLYRQMKSKGLIAGAVTLLVIALSYWAIDAGVHVKKSTGRIFNKNVMLKSRDSEYDRMMKQNGIDTGRFQAILFLPLTNTCGDKLNFSRGMETYGDAIRCSYRTGIPMIESYAPRISFADALSAIQLAADSCIEKARLKDMSDRDILLIYHENKLSPNEKWIADHSSKISVSGKTTFAALSPQIYRDKFREWMQAADSISKSLTPYGEILSDVSINQLLYRDFEDHASVNAFTGKGALYLKKGEADLFDTVLNNTSDNKQVRISFWMYVDHRTDNMPEVFLYEKGNTEQEKEPVRIENREIFNVYKKWARISYTLDAIPGMKYKLSVSGKYITVDDLLLAPKDSHVLVRNTGGQELFDNFPFRVD